MVELQLGELEARFADIIWENEPISSGELAAKAYEQLSWKKTTAFTVLKRLSDKGLFKNNKGTVTSLISREDFYAMQSERFVERSFGGSLPAFIAAFAKRKVLSAEDVAMLRRMVDQFEEE